MNIRGTSKTLCKNCGYMFLDKEKKVFMCMAKGTETKENECCKKYVYDIFKYEPKERTNFEKFTKEDFEI